jgi:pimeloyl-ACP methyl ester carboxylesterase
MPASDWNLARPRRTILRRTVRALLWAGAGLALVLVVTLAGFRWQAERREAHAAGDLAPPTGRFVTARDVRLFVQELGPRSGPTVLLIHGTGAWSETWRETMHALAGAGFRAIAIDLPPFGFSQRPADRSYAPAQQGLRIAAALEALGVARAVLVGHSFGGGPTVEAAFSAPGRIRALVAVDVALGLGTGEPRVDAPSPLLQRALALEPLRDAVVATFLTNPLFTRTLLESFVADPAAATDARVRIYQAPLAVEGTTRAIGAWLPALLTAEGTPRSATPAPSRALAVPTLVVWGDRDTITPLAQGRYLAGLIPGARLAVLEGVGHIPQIESPARFNAVLLEFVSGLAADP